MALYAIGSVEIIHVSIINYSQIYVCFDIDYLLWLWSFFNNLNLVFPGKTREYEISSRVSGSTQTSTKYDATLGPFYIFLNMVID